MTHGGGPYTAQDKKKYASHKIIMHAILTPPPVLLVIAT
jgi:hypothetical protein